MAFNFFYVMSKILLEDKEHEKNHSGQHRGSTTNHLMTNLPSTNHLMTNELMTNDPPTPTRTTRSKGQMRKIKSEEDFVKFQVPWIL